MDQILTNGRIARARVNQGTLATEAGQRKHERREVLKTIQFQILRFVSSALRLVSSAGAGLSHATAHQRIVRTLAPSR